MFIVKKYLIFKCNIIDFYILYLGLFLIGFIFISVSLGILDKW